MKEKRDSQRRSIELNVRVELQNGQRISCSLADISRSGARIVVEDPDSLPDEFVLVVKDDLRRKCKVVARTGNNLGLVFVGRPEK